MKGSFAPRYARIAFAATAIAVVLAASPTTRDYIIATAHAAAQRVLVVNNDNRPVPTTRAEEPFQVRVAVTMSTADTSGSTTISVPANMRLVLENIAAKGVSSGVQLVEVYQGTGSAFMLPQPINSGGWRWAGTTPTKVIFNPGNVTVLLRRPTGSGGTTFNYITLTGYLIPN